MDALTKTKKVSKSTTENVHLDWVDVAKGLGIFLVIYGHTMQYGTSPSISKAISSFHMPMFFILSGYISHKPKEDLHKYIFNKAYQLLLPSAILVVLVLPIYLYSIKDSDVILNETIKKILFVNGKMSYNDPIWFLIVMFQVSVIFNTIKAYQKSKLFLFLSASFTFILGYFIYFFDISLFFGFEKSIICLAFYLSGALISSVKKALPVKVKILCIICSGVIWVITGCILNSQVSLYSYRLGNYLLFVVSGITGSVMWFGLCWCLRKVTLFQTWGQNTIFVVITHFVIIQFTRIVVQKLRYVNGSLVNFILFFFALISIFAYMPLCKLVNRYLPFLNGKSVKEEVVCPK